ncbi:glycosyltransferase family protein [Cyclobacterium xiamenense]|uniref:hypothetical protein n=1 Tax=Cyclobacterium xiamenense TaxID=1297121 RepID=UPI0012BA0A16|nr:hypothetical protein [Cyclobacterium xiamenense]
MKYLIIIKNTLDRSVPILNVGLSLAKENSNTVYIACYGVSVELFGFLEKFNNLVVINLCINERKVYYPHFNMFYTLYIWLRFRFKVKEVIRNYEFDLIYLGSADTAISLRGLFYKLKYIIHLREYYAGFGFYMSLLRKPLKLAYKVVVPEENRAFLYYNHFKLKEIPIIIPNKPFFHPRKKQNIDFLEGSLIEVLCGKRFFIYQGPLRMERDLSRLLEVFKNIQEFNIVLLGKDMGMLSKYKAINPELIHIDFIPPPFHLAITSYAYGGIITYDFESLNTIYCAPNKIWEYSGFSIPMLCNQNLGLKFSVGLFNAAVFADFNDVDSIYGGVKSLIDNYSALSENSTRFFESFDYVKEVQGNIR